MNPYQELGLRTVINADGMKTRLGGSLMPPEVLEVMRRAGGNYVELPELHRAAGRKVAQLLGSPAIEDAAMVCGAAAGLAISTAACVAGTDPQRIRALPHLDWPGAKDEIVIQKTHVTGYAQGYRNAGPRLVDIGGPAGATPDEFRAAIAERTVAVTFCGGELPGNARFPTGTSLAEVVEIAHERGVPVIVDAAAELPPPGNLRTFSELGADLVVFSGGKGLRGPQSSGLILGKAELIKACRLNTNPNASMGRPMKVGKEEIAGLLKAVELYVSRDHAADLRYWDACAQTVLDAVRGLDGVAAERIIARTIPQARLTVDPARAGLTAPELAARLRDGDPPIAVAHSRDSVTINPHNLEPGEAEQVAARLRHVLAQAARQPALAAV
ncbi:MAG: aminotransferase class V-fold PLP-dependent enzyme [Chloroflexi bacterium]|nr:aminotransferase class V-fold PLP-dependent enzyme [Chloroflexota bacterium]